MDDSAIALIASTPRALLCAITVLMRVLTNSFSKYALKINFAKGKTEALMKLRGRNAVKTLDSLRHEGKISIPLPKPYESDRLRIVEHYKHLGSHLSVDGSLMFDAQHRCSSALAAYVPLAHRIFGSGCIGAWLKMHFMSSPVLSRLLYNTQLWTPIVSPVRKLNGVYMRVLRRIACDCRFGRPSHTDLEIRVKLGQPSIDCLLRRRRLLYASRILTTKHLALIAVLSLRVKSNRLPSVQT